MNEPTRRAQRRLIYYTITDPASVGADDEVWTVLSEPHVRAILGLTCGTMIRACYDDQQPSPEQILSLCELMTATAVDNNCHAVFDPLLVAALVDGAFGSVRSLAENDTRSEEIMMITIAAPSLLAIHLRLTDYEISQFVDIVDDYANQLPTHLL